MKIIMNNIFYALICDLISLTQQQILTNLLIMVDFAKLSECPSYIFHNLATEAGLGIEQRPRPLGALKIQDTHTHTTVLRLCGICPGKPG